jgi:tRNA threonylcarbamoyladenosine biosynthesis protein TsaE
VSALKLTLSTLGQTQRFGALLAGLLQPGDRLFLVGEIGAGKTTLARAIGATLQADPPLTSPTFVLMSEHQGTMPIWQRLYAFVARHRLKIAGACDDGTCRLP